jgi:hypothetical protein
MGPAWLVILLVLVPGIAAAQSQYLRPPALEPDPAIIQNPRTPPAMTIPSAPELAPELRPELRFPGPAPGAARPTKTFDLKPTIGIFEDYSDNFNRSNENAVQNFRSGITPGMQVLLDRGNVTGQAFYRLLAFYDSSTGEPGTHHQLSGQLSWQASARLKFTLTEAFAQSDEPDQSDRLNLNAGRRREFSRNLLSLTSDYSIGIIETRAYYRLSNFDADDQTTRTHAIGGTATIPIGRIHVLTLGYEYLDTKTTEGRDGSSSTGFVQGDTATTGSEITGSFSRDINPRVTAGISAAFADRDQTSSTGTESFRRWNAAIFNTYVIPEKIVMRGSIGLAQILSRNSSDTPLFTSNTDITYWFGPAIFNLVLERGFSETFAQGENFGVVETSGISGSVTYRFSPLLTGFVRASYRENDFTGQGGGQAGRKEEIATGAIGVTYHFLRWLNATFDYIHTKSTSNQADGTFSENRVRAALNASFN